ncbi:MAG: hypothetical protein RL768_2950 [Nitrospirota bacterium]|jgi:hypothetical protein
MGRTRPIVVDVSVGASRNSSLFVRWGISLQRTCVYLIIGSNFTIKQAVSVELIGGVQWHCPCEIGLRTDFP